MKRGVIVPVRIGGLVFFDEEQVRRSLMAHNVEPRRGEFKPAATKGAKR